MAEERDDARGGRGWPGGGTEQRGEGEVAAAKAMIVKDV